MNAWAWGFWNVFVPLIGSVALGFFGFYAAIAFFKIDKKLLPWKGIVSMEAVLFYALSACAQAGHELVEHGNSAPGWLWGPTTIVGFVGVFCYPMALIGKAVDFADNRVRRRTDPYDLAPPVLVAGGMLAVAAGIVHFLAWQSGTT